MKSGPTTFLNDNSHALFSKEKLVLLEAWILSDQNKLKLLYGLISPSDKEKAASWRASDFNTIGDGNVNFGKSLKIAKLFITASSSEIVFLFSALLEGKKFTDAATDAGLPKVPSKFDDLLLGTVGDSKNEFVFRPTTVGYPQAVNNLYVKRRRGAYSPERGSICSICSLYRLNKDSLWKEKGQEASVYSNEIIKSILSYLVSETGLKFSSIDANRLGNIEWISYPSITSKGKSLCDISMIKRFVDLKTGEVCDKAPTDSYHTHAISAQSIKVELLSEAFDHKVSLIVECAGYNADDLIQDFVTTGDFPDKREFQFNFTEQISGGRVKVWVSKETGQNQLWFDQHFDTIRTFSISIGTDGLAPGSSQWLNDLLNGKTEVIFHKDKLKAANFLKDFKLSDGGRDFKFDPWNPISHKMRWLSEKLYPERSDAYFMIPSGQDQAARVLEIANWINNVSKERDYQTCVLFDPFFDVLGVDVLLKTNSQIEYVAVMNSESRSNDDELRPSVVVQDIVKDLSRLANHYGLAKLERSLKFLSANTKKSDLTAKTVRFCKVRDYCQEMDDKFKGKKVRVLDIQSSTNKSGKQFFHDRYMFFFNRNGGLKAAYNLSNSIQGAMVDFPLLITPVPEDVLEPIQDYIHGFLHKQSKLETRNIVTVYSSIKERKPRVYLEGLDSFKEPQVFFSLLLGENNVKSLSLKELADILEAKGILKDKRTFVLNQNVINLSSLDKFLSSHDETKFTKIWIDFAELYGRIVDSETIYDHVKAIQGLIPNLKSLLLNSPLSIQLQDDDSFQEEELVRNHIEGIGTLLFSKALYFQKNFSFSRYRFSFFRSPALSMAIDVLEKVGWTELLNVAKTYIEKQDRSVTESYILCKIMSRLEERFYAHREEECFEYFFATRNTFLRALALASYFEFFKDESEFPNFPWLEKYFSPAEIVSICAYWTYDLRIIANQKGGVEPEAVRSLRIRLFQKIVSAYEPSFDQSLLIDVSRMVGGPSFGSWSLSNYVEIGLELEQKKKVTFEILAKVWLDPLISKIQSVADKVSANKTHFYGPSDSELTSVGAHIFVSLPSDERQKFKDQILGIYKKSNVQINRPRIRSQNFDVWHENLQVVLWIYALSIHIVSNSKRFGQDQDSEFLSLIDDVEKNFLEDDYSGYPGDLFSWVEQCRELLEKGDSNEQ